MFLCSLSLSASELPPEKLRGEWSEAEVADFATWEVAKFHGWATPFDGGSKVFFFETADGRGFNVMLANPAYWTEADRKARRQVYFVIVKNRFYRLESGGEPEQELLAMLATAARNLKGVGDEDPRLIEKLRERIQSRTPQFHAR